jgi:hypothetical protein
MWSDEMRVFFLHNLYFFEHASHLRIRCLRLEASHVKTVDMTTVSCLKQAEVQPNFETMCQTDPGGFARNGQSSFRSHSDPKLSEESHHDGLLPKDLWALLPVSRKTAMKRSKAIRNRKENSERIER